MIFLWKSIDKILNLSWIKKVIKIKNKIIILLEIK